MSTGFCTPCSYKYLCSSPSPLHFVFEEIDIVLEPPCPRKGTRRVSSAPTHKSDVASSWKQIVPVSSSHTLFPVVKSWCSQKSLGKESRPTASARFSGNTLSAIVPKQNVFNLLASFLIARASSMMVLTPRVREGSVHLRCAVGADMWQHEASFETKCCFF